MTASLPCRSAERKFGDTLKERAELRMELCTKSSQFRAAPALWQRLLQGEWPGFEGATVPKDQAPATIPADSPIRRLYLLALIGATKHPKIHGHPTICQTAAQITPVLTKEMMATPTISWPGAADGGPVALPIHLPGIDHWQAAEKRL